MSISDADYPLDADFERHIDGSLLQNINSSTSQSPTLSRAQPGAVLLSPTAQAHATPSLLLSPEPLGDLGPPGIISPATTNSNMALLSPPGSRYAFDINENNPVSPLLSSTTNPLIGNFNNTSIQRPLSAQSFNINNTNNNNDAFDAFRPFSAQGGISSNHVLNVPERPLSSMEIDSITFKNDVGNLIDWISTLNTNQHRVVIDNLVANLPIDILNYTREKLTYPDRQHGAPNFQFHEQSEPLTLDSVLNSTVVQPTPLEAPTAIHLQRALSPNFPSYDRGALLQDLSFNRPRSADPYSKFNRGRPGYEPELNRTPSKSRSKYEDENTNQYNQRSGGNVPFDITNLAQQLTQTPIKTDYNNPNALKLSALSTINSRVQLDSNKKRVVSPQEQQGGRPISGGFHTVSAQHVYNINEELNAKNSSSVPQPHRVNYYESISNSPSMNRVINKQRTLNRNSGNYSNDPELQRLASLNSAVKNLSLTEQDYHTPYKQNTQASHNSVPKSPAINTKQVTSLKLLNDIPAWLKSLRLHKYTSALQEVPWKELIYLDDKQLEDKGVSAMGARGKLLKAFEVVRDSYESGLIDE